MEFYLEGAVSVRVLVSLLSVDVKGNKAKNCEVENDPINAFYVVENTTHYTCHNE